MDENIRINNILELIDDYINKSKKNSITTEALRGLKDHILKINSLLNIKKYDVVFIGQKAYGKTTTLCQSFDLFVDKEEKDNLERNELFMTGRGATTLCEIIVKPDKKTYFEIIPFSYEEMDSLISVYAINYWRNSKGDVLISEQDDNSSKYIPDELDRALENVINLSDECLEEFASSLGNTEEDMELFVEKLKLSANIKERNLEFIEYNYNNLENSNNLENNNNDEKDWIKENFKLVNLVKIPNMPIPRKIVVHIRAELLNKDKFQNINQLIDTRGLDLKGLKTRDDLDLYFNHSDDKIFVIIDKFPHSLSESVGGVISKYTNIKTLNITEKCILIINFEEEDLSGFVGNDGYLSDDKALESKSKKIKKALNNLNISLEENVLFYNPLMYFYKKKNKKITNKIDLNNIYDNNIALVNLINSKIDEKKRNLEVELKQLENDFQSSIKQYLTHEDKKYLALIKNNLNILINNKIESCDFAEILIRNIKNLHHTQIDAINRGYGEWFYESIYLLIKNIISEKIDSELKENLNKVINTIEEQAKYENCSSIYKTVLLSLNNLIKGSYENFKSISGEKVKEIALEDIFSPRNRQNYFWEDVIQRYGKGNGYKAYICDKYIKNMNQKDFVNKINSEINQKWKYEFVDKIVEFLEDEKSRVFLDSSMIIALMNDKNMYNAFFNSKIFKNVTYYINTVIVQEILLKYENKKSITSFDEIEKYTEILSNEQEYSTLNNLRNTIAHGNDILILESAINSCDYLVSLDQKFISLYREELVDKLKILSSQEFLSEVGEEL